MTRTVTSIRYSLAPSASDALGLDDEEACEVYARALQEQHPSAVIEVTPNRTDESRVEYEGIVGEELFTATQRGSRVYVGAVSDGMSATDVRALEESLRAADADAWERAVALAADALDSLEE